MMGQKLLQRANADATIKSSKISTGKLLPQAAEQRIEQKLDLRRLGYFNPSKRDRKL